MLVDSIYSIIRKLYKKVQSLRMGDSIFSIEQKRNIPVVFLGPPGSRPAVINIF